LNGPFAWALYGLGMHAGRRRLSLLDRKPFEVTKPEPKVTILIPAKDEGEPIRECLTSALAQDYPNFEVLAIDDRSNDNTGAIMDEFARRDSRLRVLHIPHRPIPAGWTGKNNALFTALKTVDSGWFLFVDSDVILRSNALRKTMAYATSTGYGLVSLLLRLECRTFWEGLLMPLAAAGIVGTFGVGLANNNHYPSIAFANGQFILCRRDTYEAFGTHAAVKSAFSEDVEIARLAKRKGLMPRAAWGTDLAAVRMYAGLPKLIKGWARNFFGCGRGSPWPIIAGAAFVIGSCYSVYPALGMAIYSAVKGRDAILFFAWSLASLTHLVLMTFFLTKTYAWSGNPKRNAWLFPIGGALMLWIFALALKLCVTRRVEWRGDSYSR
jgi:chlorobactene glucosyltransferase